MSREPATAGRLRTPIRRAAAVVLTLAALSALAAIAWASVAQTPLKLAKPGGSILGSAVSPSYFVWAHAGSATHGGIWISEQAMTGGLPAGAITTVSSTGDAFPGSIAGTRLVYEQEVAGQWNLHFFNLATHTHSNPPLGVNTNQRENDPSITTTWLMFDRSNTTSARVLLFNLQTHSVRVLEDATGPNFAIAGQVNGNYAVYDLCHSNNVARTTVCHVELYTISTRTTQQIPLATGQPDDEDLSPAVSPAGTVYFTRDPFSDCGDQNQIMKRPLGGPTTTIFTLKLRYSAHSYGTYNDGQNELSYVKSTCGNAGSGVFRISNP